MLASDLEEIFPGISDLEIDLSLPFCLKDGHAKDYEYKLICGLIKYQALRASEEGGFLVLEVGTFDGLSTLQIANNIPEWGVVHTINLPAGARPKLNTDHFNDKYTRDVELGTRFLGAQGEFKIRQHFIDSADMDVRDLTGGKAVDVAFIDGCHSFEYCQNDTLKALGALKPGGIVIWHDYLRPMWPGVTEFVNQFARAGNKVFWFGGQYEMEVDGRRCSVAFHQLEDGAN